LRFTDRLVEPAPARSQNAAQGRLGRCRVPEILILIESVTMRRHHKEIFEGLRKHTGMYLLGETFAEVTAFVDGYDQTCEGGTLCGFEEWLVVRLGLKNGANLHWSALILDAAFPGSTDSRGEVSADSRAQRHAIETLFDLLVEFDEARSKHDGLKKIFLEYDRWQRRRLR